MGARGWWLVGMLVVLFLANVAMLMGMTNWPLQVRESFVNGVASTAMGMSGSGSKVEPFMNFVGGAGGAPFATASIGAYDGLNLAASLPAAAQGFRGTLPNEPLAGPPINVDADHLFIYANNQCKPECCDSTLACDGGCVCTTPAQRDYINRRGGNSNGVDF
jgi:hypothetical protein